MAIGCNFLRDCELCDYDIGGSQVTLCLEGNVVGWARVWMTISSSGGMGGSKF